MKIRSVSLPDDLDQQVEAAAQREGARSYSSLVREILEAARADRLAAPQTFADSAVKDSS